MIRDQAILVRPDGSVMFDRPNELGPKAGGKRNAESRDHWHNRTVSKAKAAQEKRGAVLLPGERIASEERPDPKVRNAIRMNRLTGKLTVLLEPARELLAKRYLAETAYHMNRLKEVAQVAKWFELVPGIESMRVVWFEQQVAAVESEARHVADQLAKAQSVEDLIAIEPKWPKLME